MVDRNKYDEIYDKTGYKGSQYKSMKASTQALIDIMKQKLTTDEAFTLLDAGCGDGAVIDSICNSFLNAICTGFDYSETMVSYARSHLPDRVRIGQGSIFDIGAFTPEDYDVLTSIHTLSLFDEIETPLRQLINKAKRYVFINSLFSSHNVDLKTVMHEPGYPPINWNIWSMKRFKNLALEYGANNVEFIELEMPYDLPYVNEGTGSYTKTLIDGKRITFTGPLFLPWYIVVVCK